MTPHVRKFIGAVLILVVLTLYAFAVMLAATSVLPGASKIVEALFYAVAGLAWVVPAGLLISWMHRGGHDA